MSRSFHDMTPEEQSAYRVYQSKLADRTLPAAEHDRIRKAIDELMWKGPNAQILLIRQQLERRNQQLTNLVEAMADRVARLEFHVGLAFALHTGSEFIPLDLPPAAGGPTPRPVFNPLPVLSTAPVVNPLASSVAADIDPFDVPGVTAEVVSPEAEEPAAKGRKGRGRPPGAKNKPKAAEPPVPSGEGLEQPATAVVEGNVTEVLPSFTDQMILGDTDVDEFDPLTGEPSDFLS